MLGNHDDDDHDNDDGEEFQRSDLHSAAKGSPLSHHRALIPKLFRVIETNKISSTQKKTC